MLASRMSRIASSPTLKGLLAADRLRSQGMDVVDLGAGEPDFPTPDHVKAAARAAIDGNFTKYTANAGITNLREAIAAKYAKDYGISFTAAEVIVTAGGKQALANAALSVFGPGDEVITHVPGWPTIVEQIKLADATPVVVRTSAEDGFTLHAQPLIDAITPKTKGFIINSPANPTGALITEGELTKLAQAAKAQGPLDRPRPLLRAADLRAGAAQPAGRPVPRDARAGDRLRLGVEGLLDDRLALRLDGRAEGGHRRLRRAPEPPDVERLLDHAEGRRRGADRSAGLRHGDARTSTAAAATRCGRG